MLPPKAPTIVFEPQRDRTMWRWIAFSGLVHAAIIFAALWDWSNPSLTEMTILTPGGPGPIGGGGGGGGRRITYVLIPAYQPPPQQKPPQQPQIRPEELVIPKPPIEKVEIEQVPVFEIPKTAVEAGAPVLGQGPGIGGGPGAGTGTGGGIGSGRGTGVGSGVGPGTGGQGGDIFPPAPRYTILPPEPRPESVRGRTYRARFTVGPDGHVLEVVVEPSIRDGEYRRRLMAQLYEWSFAPAVTREGVPVRGESIVTFTL